MTRSILLPFLLAATAVSAQQINNVTVTPTPVRACVPTTFHVTGTGPGNYSMTYLTSDFSGSTISLIMDMSSGGSGSTPFNIPVGPLGPFLEGPYNLVVSLRYNQNILNTWTGSLTVLPAILPNVGEENSIDVCPNDAPFTLISQLGGTPDPGGDWINPQLQVVTNGMFVPGVSPAGWYMYYFDLPAACDDIEPYQMLQITYLPNSTAGSSATVTLCTAPGAPEVPLIDQLGGDPDPGGTWTGPGTSGVFTPGTSQPGTYVYHVDGIGTCPDPSATLTVLPGPPSIAGTGGTAFFCEDETSADLSSYIWGGAQSGIWYSPTGLGITYYGSPIDVSSYGAGTYKYVVTAVPCPSDTAYLDVTLLAAPCTVGMEEDEQANGQLQVLPNPATNQVHVEAIAGTAARILEMVDASGRVVLRETLQAGFAGPHVLDISALARGLYTLRLLGGEALPTQRIVVE
ncbi:MAG: T9SS type A sorting domain-containing protein [Flavobacteriales bacterium]|nr:T9SS type A sorting domain-containing protein [Flavobacteriales bacterium]